MNTAVDQMPESETIVAIASAVGVAALSIVRLSGTHAHSVTSRICHGVLPPVRMARVRKIGSPDGEILDEAVVVCYTGPRSYTGEDCAEIICHGGWVTSARVIQAAVAAGARPARPGEFTRRAVLNGRVDLLQAEATNDLIRAESSASARQALDQLDGGLSDRILKIREGVLRVEALIAYEIDFPEEDDGPQTREVISGAVMDVIGSLDKLLATAPRGELIRRGAVVAIVGPTNVGKSSLFNALLGRRRALVSELPGTTRDALEAVLDILPIALRLVDTAGLRDTAEPIEQLGMALSREYIASADVVVACGDSAETLRDAVDSARVARGFVLPVLTKSDLGDTKEQIVRDDVTRVSSKSGEGLDQLICEISAGIEKKAEIQPSDMPAIAHARYRDLLRRGREELVAFHNAWWGGSIPVTVGAVHLRQAVGILEELIGPIEIDDILESLFSTFCVGK